MKDYLLTIRFLITGSDDVEARERALKLLYGPLYMMPSLTNVKLQRLEDNKEPKKVPLTLST